MSERMKRLKFIKEHAPRKFEEALMSGKLVPSAGEMNELYHLKKKK